MHSCGAEADWIAYTAGPPRGGGCGSTIRFCQLGALVCNWDRGQEAGPIFPLLVNSRAAYFPAFPLEVETAAPPQDPPSGFVQSFLEHSSRPLIMLGTPNPHSYVLSV